MNEQLVAHVSKGKTALLILAAAGFVAAGVWFVIDANAIAASSRRLRDPTIVQLIGWGAILLGLGGGAVMLRQLLRDGPVMEIDDRGILWRRWSDQVIPWSAIVRAEPHAVYNQKFLSLWLDAPERYPARSTLGKLSRMNKGMGFGDLALSMQGTDQSFDRLLDVVGAYLNARDQRVGTGSGPE